MELYNNTTSIVMSCCGSDGVGKGERKVQREKNKVEFRAKAWQWSSSEFYVKNFVVRAWHTIQLQETKSPKKRKIQKMFTWKYKNKDDEVDNT